MIRFDTDYAEGAHPAILEELVKTNFVQSVGYGFDEYSLKAANKIRELIEKEKADVYFISGGTQCNIIAISSFLSPWQSVISADTGHINTLEVGAIEATGHKISLLPHSDGKIYSEQIEELCNNYQNSSNKIHITEPKLVYITHPTEFGVNYTKSELENISNVCKKNHLLLFLDGARLGYGLVAEDNDLMLPDIAKFCDVFYIGGTKVGALFGEALVVSEPKKPNSLIQMIKQRGALFAKGRILGLQFFILFKDNLYLDISKKAVFLSKQLRNELIEKKYNLLYNSNTNQNFVKMDTKKLEKLSLKYTFGDFSNLTENQDKSTKVVRICTSWATCEENVKKLISDL